MGEFWMVGSAILLTESHRTHLGLVLSRASLMRAQQRLMALRSYSSLYSWAGGSLGGKALPVNWVNSFCSAGNQPFCRSLSAGFQTQSIMVPSMPVFFIASPMDCDR